MKSLDGWISVNCRVLASTALMPEMLCVFWNLAMFAAVGGVFFAF